MELNYIWSIIEPYITYALAFLTSAGGAAVIGNLVAKRTINRLNVSDITKGVAERLSGSKLNIDLKAVTEKQLKKIAESFEGATGKLRENSELILSALVKVLEVISSSAKLKDTEAEEILKALEGVKAASKPIETKDEITIEIESSVEDDIANSKTGGLSL